MSDSKVTLEEAEELLLTRRLAPAERRVVETFVSGPNDPSLDRLTAKLVSSAGRKVQVTATNSGSGSLSLQYGVSPLSATCSHGVVAAHCPLCVRFGGQGAPSPGQLYGQLFGVAAPQGTCPTCGGNATSSGSCLNCQPYQGLYTTTPNPQLTPPGPVPGDLLVPAAPAEPEDVKDVAYGVIAKAGSEALLLARHEGDSLRIIGTINTSWDAYELLRWLNRKHEEQVG